jgi:hypothetical protein
LYAPALVWIFATKFWQQKRTDHNSSARFTIIIPTTMMNLLSILAIAAVAVNMAGECLYPFSHSFKFCIDWFLVVLILFSSSFFASACLIHHIYIAESAFATTIAATDAADDVAIMSIESEGSFNQAMAMGNMLRGRGAAGVVSIRDNKDSFNEVKEALLAQCKNKGESCSKSSDCCEYK